MKYYKIIGTYPNVEKLNELISDTIYIEHLKENSPALLVYVDENLEPSFNKCMRTSTVQQIKKVDDFIIITTRNSIYTLQELVLG